MVFNTDDILYVLWLQDDGFTKTGCLNTKCAGFQAEKGAAIAPGDVIQNVSPPNPKGGAAAPSRT